MSNEQSQTPLLSDVQNSTELKRGKSARFGKLYRGPISSAYNRQSLGSIPSAVENILFQRKDGQILKFSFSLNNNLRYNDEDNSNEETKDSSKDVLFIKKINNINNKEKNKLNFSFDQKNHIKKLIDQKRMLNPLSKSMNLNKYGDDFDKFVENFDKTEISDANLILSSDLDDIYKNIYDDSVEFKNDVFFKGLRHLDDRIGLFDKK
jgi:hypothetical protein